MMFSYYFPSNNVVWGSGQITPRANSDWVPTAPLGVVVQQLYPLSYLLS